MKTRDPPKAIYSLTKSLKKGEDSLREKSMFKRIGSTMLALLCCASALTNGLADLFTEENTITAEAAEQTLYRVFDHKEGTLGVNLFYDANDRKSLNQFMLRINSINGDPYKTTGTITANNQTKKFPIAALCMDRSASSKSQYRGATDAPNIVNGTGGTGNLTNEQAREMMALVEYFGYPYGQGDYQRNSSGYYVPLGMSQSYHAASQLLVWQIANGNRNTRFKLVPGKGSSAAATNPVAIRNELSSYNTTDYNEDIYTTDLKGNGVLAYDRISERIQNYYTKPNWNGRTYQLKYNSSTKKFEIYDGTKKGINDKHTIQKDENTSFKTRTYNMMGLHENVKYEISYDIQLDATDGYGYNDYTLTAAIPLATIRNATNFSSSFSNGVLRYYKTYKDSLTSDNMQRKTENSEIGISNSKRGSSTSHIMYKYSDFKLDNESLKPVDTNDAQWMWFGNIIPPEKSASLTLESNFIEADITKTFKNTSGQTITNNVTSSSGKDISTIRSQNANNIYFTIKNSQNGNYVKFTTYSNGGNAYLLFDSEVSNSSNATKILLNGNYANLDTTSGIVTMKTLLPEGYNFVVTETNNSTEFSISGTSSKTSSVSNTKKTIPFVNEEIEETEYDNISATLTKKWQTNTMDNAMTTKEVSNDPDYSSLLDSSKIWYYAGVKFDKDGTGAKDWYFKKGVSPISDALSLKDASKNLYTMDNAKITGPNLKPITNLSDGQMLNQYFGNFLTDDISEAQVFYIDQNFIDANGISIEIPETYYTSSGNKTFDDKSLFIQEHNEYNPDSTRGDVQWTYIEESIDADINPKTAGLSKLSGPDDYIMYFEKNASSRTMINAEIYFMFKTRKVEEGTDTSVGGAYYDLYDNTTGEKLETAISDELTGELVFESKLYPAHTYYFVESPDYDPPVGYQRDTTQHWIFTNPFANALIFGYEATFIGKKNNFVELYYSTDAVVKDGYWTSWYDTAWYDGAGGSNPHTSDPIEEPIELYPLTIEKVDEFGSPVEGVKFKVTAVDVKDPAGNDRYADPVIATDLETDEDGIARLDDLYAGIYSVQEVDNSVSYKTSTQAGYTTFVASNEIVTVQVGPGEDTNAEFHDGQTEFVNYYQKVDLSIEKKNEKNEDLEGAVFRVQYAGAFTVNGHQVASNLQTVGTIETSKVDGTVVNVYKDASSNVVDKLELYTGARYRIQEIQAPVGYVADSTSRYIKVDGNNSTDPFVYHTETFTNSRKTVKIRILKKNTRDEFVQGAKFTLKAAEDINYTGTLWKANDAVIEENVETDADGYATFTTEVPVGFSYKIVETYTPPQYQLLSDPVIINVAMDEEADPDEGEYVERTIVNEDATVQVKVYKEGEDPNSSSAGTIPLSGAVYKLYYNGAGTVTVDGVDYTKDQLIETSSATGSNGYTTFTKKLPKGKQFYIVESTAPTGYVLDTSKHYFTISESYNSATPYVITQDDPLQKLRVNVVKKYKKLDGTEGTQTLAGARYQLEATDTVVINGTTYTSGSVIATSGLTSTDGNATFNVDLPMDHVYKVVEIKAPTNFTISDDNEQLIQMSPTANNTVEFNYGTVTFYNTPKTGIVKAVKKDANNSSIGLNGAKFKLTAAEDIILADGTCWEYNGVEIRSGVDIATVTTATVGGEAGIANFPEVPVGYNYTVTEVEAPANYTRDDVYSQTFTFADDPSQNTVLYKTVTFDNTPQKGIIKVYKKAVVNGVQTDIPLSGAKFTLKAAENVTQSGTTLYTSGQVIETVTTGTNGLAEFSEVPVGFRYTVTETEPPDNYVNSGYSTTFLLEYQATLQDVEYVTKLLDDAYNPWQDATVTVVKYRQEPDGTTTTIPLRGAEFELRTVNAINYADGTLMYAANQKIGSTVTTGTDGKATFTVQVPVGYTYKIVEVNAPAGYKNLNNVTQFTVTGNKTIQYVEVSQSVYDPPIKINVSKKKLADMSELSGASLKIVKNDGTDATLTIDGSACSWISDGTVKVIEKIPAGSYKLVETVSPNGYAVATEIPFVVAEDGTVTSTTSGAVTTANGVPQINMIDDYTRIRIIKKDIGTNQPLPGAKLQVLDGSTVVIPEWSTTTSGKEIVGQLKVGKTYTLHETAAPDGYLIARDVTFTVTNTTDWQEVEMSDDYTKIDFSKKDINGTSELPGAKFEIRYASDDTIVTLNGSQLKWTSGTTAHRIDKLPAGTYKYVETEAPEGYLLADPITFTVTASGAVTSTTSISVSSSAGVYTITMRDARVSVGIEKVDADTGERLEGAVLVLKTADGTVVEQWTSDGTPKVFTGLAYGNYIIEELKAVRGYNTGDPTYFTVDENTDSVTINYNNRKGFKMPETGGNGTIVLISVGIILILAGVGYFVIRKKKQ